jgi:hypothetical protein
MKNNTQPQPTTQDWEEDWDKLTDTENKDFDYIQERCLYKPYEYPESMYELDELRVKNFISQAIQSARLEAQIDLLDSMPEPTDCGCGEGYKFYEWKKDKLSQLEPRED